MHVRNKTTPARVVLRYQEGKDFMYVYETRNSSLETSRDIWKGKNSSAYETRQRQARDVIHK